MEILRTPEHRFAAIADFPFAPRYTEIDGLRYHHVEAGPADADPVLLLHGEPTWSYLYRKMIPPIAAAGHRAVAPDLIGFGRSDKPAGRSAYSYAAHVEWMKAWVRARALERITLVVQDWGSLIGLRMLAEMPERFARVVVANGFLPTGERPPPAAFRVWQAFARWTPWFPTGWIVQAGCTTRLAKAVRAAYDAPFPDARHQAASRAFPLLVPTSPDDPAAAANAAAWRVLERWERPLLTAFGDRDPIFRGADRVLQRRVPGAAGQPHTTIRGGGHFIQEDRGEALARVVIDFISRTS